MPFLFLDYIKNRYAWKECTGIFLIILISVKYLKKIVNNICLLSQKLISVGVAEASES